MYPIKQCIQGDICALLVHWFLQPTCKFTLRLNKLPQQVYPCECFSYWPALYCPCRKFPRKLFSSHDYHILSHIVRVWIGWHCNCILFMCCSKVRMHSVILTKLAKNHVLSVFCLFLQLAKSDVFLSIRYKMGVMRPSSRYTTYQV